MDTSVLFKLTCSVKKPQLQVAPKFPLEDMFDVITVLSKIPNDHQVTERTLMHSGIYISCTSWLKLGKDRKFS
jgi:hypothetical protein